MLVAVLHFFSPEDDPYGLVATLVRAPAPGSYLIMSHATADYVTPEDAPRVVRSGRAEGFYGRGRSAFASFFDGLELVDPGIVPVSEWRADDEPDARPSPAEVGCHGAVAGIV